MPSTVSAVWQYLRASGVSLLGQIIYYAIYFGGIRLILSSLPKAENGVLTFTQQWSAAAFSIALMSGYTTYILHRLRTEEKPVDFFSTIIWLRSAVSVLIMGVLVLVFSNIYGIPPCLTLAASMSVLLMSRGNTLRTTFELPVQANMQFGLLALLNILDVILVVGMLWWQRSSLNAQMVLLIQTVASIPSFCILLIHAVRQGLLRWSVRLQIVRALFAEPRPLSIVALLLYLHTLIDLIMLEWLGTRTMLGVFGASSYGAVPMNILLGIVWSPLIPILSQRMRSVSAEIFHADAERMLRLVTVAIGLVGLILAGLVTITIELLTGGTYHNHRMEFLLQLGVAALSAMIYAMQQYGSLLERYHIAVASVGGLVVGSLLFDWWLIPLRGTAGLLIAKILSHLLGISWCVVLLVRSGYSVIARSVVQLCMWIIFCGLGVWLMHPSADLPLLNVALLVSSGFIMALAIGVLRPSDWVYLRSRLR